MMGGDNPPIILSTYDKYIDDNEMNHYLKGEFRNENQPIGYRTFNLC